MATTTLKTRIQHKYNTPAKWAEDTSFVPLKGEICVFNNGTGVKPEMKIGDGTTTLASLPFLKAGGDMAISRSLTSGTKIATITIDGVATDLYCQTNTNTTYSAGTGLSLSGTTFSTNNNKVFMFYDRTDIGTSPNYDDPGVNGHFELRSSSEVTGETGIKPFDSFGSFISIKNSNTMLQLAGNSQNGFYIRAKQSANVTLSNVPWQEILTNENYTAYTVTKTGSGASGTWGINITGNAATASSVAWSGITGKPSTFTPSSHTHNNIVSSGTMTAITGTAKWPAGFTVGDIYSSGYPFSFGTTWMYQGTFGAELIFNGVGGDADAGTGHMHFRTRSDWATSTWGDWKKLWRTGDSITGAVWNDYAEYRESDCAEFGRVLTENGDDTLSPTTERLQHFAGISSDTWGFCQGETERAKTPIAVAGRVLAYTYRNRNEYKPGDCVCAAPNGTVDIMTREEIEKYPDRIVGTVSCVPDYEEWGQGDRPAVKVDGRIWVKVR